MNTPQPESIIDGLSACIHGFGLLFKFKLKRYLLLPLLINIIIFGLLFIAGIYLMLDLTAGASHWLPSWLTWLSWLAWPLFIISFGAFFIYGFTYLANLIAAPFNGLLAEKIYAQLTGNLPAAEASELSWRMIKRLVKRQAKVLLYYLPRVLLCWLLFIIPIINIIAALLLFVFHARTIALQYFDYPIDLSGQDFLATRQYLKQERMPTHGFGAVVLICSYVPILNLVIMPAAVCGATWYFARHSAKS